MAPVWMARKTPSSTTVSPSTFTVRTVIDMSGNAFHHTRAISM